MKRLLILLIILTVFVMVLPVTANELAVPSAAMTETILANEVPTAIVVHDFSAQRSGVEIIFIVQGILIALGLITLAHPVGRAMLLDSIGRTPQLRKAVVTPDSSSPLAVAPVRDETH